MIVTDTAIGEVAFRMINGEDQGLISLSPSDWTHRQIHVLLRNDETKIKFVSIKNWWEPRELEQELKHQSPPIRSWQELSGHCISKFDGFIFLRNHFPHFSKHRFLRVHHQKFNIARHLNALTQSYDGKGNHAEQEHKIYNDYFKGERGWFSDSSDNEKHRFYRELKFSDQNLRYNRKEGSLRSVIFRGNQIFILLCLLHLIVHLFATTLD